MYNLTNITSANTIPEIMKATNDLAGGLLFGLYLFLFFIMYLSIMKKQDFKVVLLAGGFVTAIIAGYFYFMGWIPLWSLLWPAFIMFAAIILFLITD